MGFRKSDLGFSDTGEDLIGGYFRKLLRESEPDPSWEETDFPPLDIYETAGDIVVEVELPGVLLEGLEVAMAAGMLIVEGVKEEVFEHGRVNFLCMERSFGAFRRVVPLMHPIDSSRITAVYGDGVLEVRIPKVDEKRGRRRIISVKRR